MKVLEDQLLRYPRCKLDDLIDCLADITEVCYIPDTGSESERVPATLQEHVDHQFKVLDSPEIFTDEVLGDYF